MAILRPPLDRGMTSMVLGGLLDNDANGTVQQLLDKATEAFVLAIELYNRSSIRYRVEGFAFFVCNAWELMLKAKSSAIRVSTLSITRTIRQEPSRWNVA